MSTANVDQLRQLAGLAIDHIDSIIVVLVTIASLAFMAVVIDNDNGWNIWRMFFTDTFSDTMSAVGRKKHSKHSYRGGFGVAYGTGESNLWGVFRTMNWVASATFLFSAVEMVQAQASYPDPLATRCIICLAYLFAFGRQGVRPMRE